MRHEEYGSQRGCGRRHPPLVDVLDAVIRHWVTVVVPTTYGLEGRDLSVGGGGGFHRLWEPSLPGHCLQVFRESSLRGQQQMAGVGLQPVDGMAEVGKADMGID